MAVSMVCSLIPLPQCPRPRVLRRVERTCSVQRRLTYTGLSETRRCWRIFSRISYGSLRNGKGFSAAWSSAAVSRFPGTAEVRNTCREERVGCPLRVRLFVGCCRGCGGGGGGLILGLLAERTSRRRVKLRLRNLSEVSSISGSWSWCPP